MLIEFRVGNFLSFKDIVTLSMLAAPISEHQGTSVFSIRKFELLKSLVIYGANASGKSNLLKAMSFMKWFIINSSKETQATESIKIESFRLSAETENKPSFFEIEFICEQKKYRYGFELNKESVHSEWLFFVPSRQEARLFVREEDKISVGTTYFKEGLGLEDKTRPNALFLSVVAQFNGEIATKILKWFNRCNYISGLNDQSYLGFTLQQAEKEQFVKRALKYLQIVDLGIGNIEYQEAQVAIQKLPQIIKRLNITVLEEIERVEGIKILTAHNKYNSDGEIISIENFELDIHESKGTLKFFAILGPLLDTLDNGKILIIDELDARFHPLITRFVIQLFHSGQTNFNNAQLIFATHDTNLLTNKLFRRDQIWFTEKDQYEATDLYSLIEYKEADKKVRKDASFGKDYIQGKYGAIPFIGDFELLLGAKYE